MIVEMPEGRELDLPGVSAEAALRIGEMIVAAEDRAAVAELRAAQECALLREEIATLRQQVMAMGMKPAPVPESPELGIVTAVQRLESTMKFGFERMVKAQTADRMLVKDATGEPVRSRVV